MKLLISLLFISSIVFCEVYVQPKKVVWDIPNSDVLWHRVFVVPENDNIDIVNTLHIDLPMPTNEYVLPGIFIIINGNYKVAVGAIDANGNIATTEIIVPLDFTPPNAPTGVQVIDL